MEAERRKVILVCCVVGFLGLLSAATGFAAEAKRIKVGVDSIIIYACGIVNIDEVISIH